ncbi:expressed unknown protein [Seminavis robusta]|uniref:Uncharacterized protein n=1 Tax=Seminavis robusta TaxID=568900 RepID=A0A9N8F0K0_9STRA|nr:expressed unknown protein [Seminavis robusta]|eukprot:Sro2613_g332630.1 n/a (634) ;mRNA; f:9274-11175
MSEGGSKGSPEGDGPQEQGRGAESPAKRQKLINEEDETLEKLRRQIAVLEKEKAILEMKNKKYSRKSLESLLFKVEEGDLKVVSTGNDKSHVGGHDEAKAINKKIYLPTFDQQKVRKCCEVSRVLQKFVDTEKTTDDKLVFREILYNSEADIAAIVLAAAEDAIELLKQFHSGRFREDSIETSMERSFLSCRPDILVVSFNRVPILTIEIKKPIPGDGSLTDNGVVLGQVFDQAQVVQAHSQKDVPCVLSTFSESVVCWPPESNTKDLLDQCFPSSTASSSSTGDQQDSPSSVRANKPGLTQSPPSFKSPLGIARTVSDSPPEADEKPSFTPLKTEDRKLAVSQSFKAHDIVKVLYAAICVAYDVTAPYDQKSEIYKLEPGKMYNFDKALRVEDKGGYTWGKLSNVKLGEKIHDQRGARASSRSNRTQSDNDNATARGPYFIIGRLGFGSTSNVFHALNCDGKEVALKVYVKNEDRTSKRVLSKDEFEKEAIAATTREKELLLKLYGFLKNRVHVVSLFEGLQCVVMPVFTPVEKEKRPQMLPGIQAVLERFGKAGLKYNASDIRWRHVGRLVVQGGGTDRTECILYDLANLDVVTAEDKDCVEKHILGLKERSEEEKQQEGGMFALEVVDNH